MFPLRDINPVRTTPLVTWMLVVANVSVWLWQVWLSLAGGDLPFAAFVERWGVVPVHLTELDPSAAVTPFSSMFLHGGWFHLIGNMWFLWVFGDNVEERMGRTRFLLFYLLCGLAAVMTHVTLAPESSTPVVGASGAIAGVLAAYLVLHAMARVVTLIPPFFLVEVPAFVFLFVWFGIQLLHGTATLRTLGEGQGGVAFFAHVGGFLAGLVLVFAFRRPKHKPRRSTASAKHGHRPSARRTEWGRDLHRPDRSAW